MLSSTKRLALPLLIIVAMGGTVLAHAAGSTFATFQCVNENNHADIRFPQLQLNHISGTRDVVKEASSWLISSKVGSFTADNSTVISLQGEGGKVDGFAGSVFVLNQPDRQSTLKPLAFPGADNLPGNMQTAEAFCGGLVKICTDTIGPSYTKVKVMDSSKFEYVPIVLLQDKKYYGCAGASPSLSTKEASTPTLYCEGQDHQNNKKAPLWTDKATQQWLAVDVNGSTGVKDGKGRLALWGKFESSKSGNTFVLYQKTSGEFLDPLSFSSASSANGSSAKAYCKALVKMCKSYDRKYAYVGVSDGELKLDLVGGVAGLAPVSVMENGESYSCPNYASELIDSKYDASQTWDRYYSVTCRDPNRSSVFSTNHMERKYTNGKATYDLFWSMSGSANKEKLDSLVGHPWCASR